MSGIFTRRSIITAALAAAAFMLAACGGDSGSSTQPAAGGGASANKKLKLAFVTNNASDFWTIAKAGIDKAVQDDPSLSAEFKLGDNTPGTQKAIIDSLLATGIDGISISPNDPKNQTEVLNNAAAKALLITQDSDAPDSKRAFYIGTDNFAAGVQAGEELKKVLPNGGKIAVFVGTLDAQNAKDRFGGIKKAIEGTKIEVVKTLTDDADAGRAKTNVADTLTANKDLACLVGLYSYNGPAIIAAVRDAKMQGKIKIVCFDEADETLEGIKSGDINVTIVQQPYEFGRLSMVNMAKYLRGDKSFVPANKMIIVPTLAITKDKVDEFWTNLKKLRGK